MSDEGRPRARQACEPCRRKKSKCPGERPVCSFCSRLNQPCTYVKPSDDYRIQKASNADSSLYAHRDQVDVLASRMGRIEELVSLFSATQPAARSSTRNMSLSTSIFAEPTSELSSGMADHEHSSPEQSTFHPLHRPIPPRDVLAALADVFTQNFCTVGCLVFEENRLRSQMLAFPRALLWVFLGLAVRLSDHPFFHGTRDSAASFYTNAARRSLLAEISSPVRSVEMLQALCLNCYADILDGRAASALMSIGVAARYALCTNILTMNSKTSGSLRQDEVARCLWSLFYLDRTYGSSFNMVRAMPEATILPDIPTHMSNFVMPSSLARERYDKDDDPLHHIHDPGIGSHVLKLVSIWGDLMAYLQQIRLETREKAWQSQSAYLQIKSQIFEFECHLPQKHRFDFVRFDERSRTDIAQSKHYWEHWILSQMLYHGIQAVLNHPFLHFFRKNDQQSVRPPSFQQNVIDQAILHSRWIVRIVELCQEKEWHPSDPFVAHLVSVIATVNFFLSFSKDENLAAKAIENFDKCESFVGQLAARWNHLNHTKSKLTKLAEILPRSLDTRHGTRRPKVNGWLVWSLLDYAASSSPEEESPEVSEVVEVDVNTQHLSPLEQMSLNKAQTSYGVLPPGNTSDWIDDTFSADMLDIPDMPGFSVPFEYWTGGQL